jgi:hypothetical protein
MRGLPRRTSPVVTEGRQAVRRRGRGELEYRFVLDDADYTLTYEVQA